MPPLPARARTWPAVLAALTIAVAAVGAGLAIVASPWWSAAEVRVVAAVQGASNVGFDLIALTINIVFGPSGAAVVAALTVLWVILLSRSWRLGARVLLVLIASWGCAELVKPIVRRPRPDPAALRTMIVPEPHSFGYPSGHTAFAAALVCALVLVVARGRARPFAVAGGVVVVVATAWSRVYLGVHYPTDVGASMVVVPAVAIAVHRLTAGLDRQTGDAAGTPAQAARFARTPSPRRGLRNPMDHTHHRSPTGH